MKRSPLFIIFLTVFIDLLGFGIAIPVLPALAQENFQASPAVIGLLIACFSFFQMIFTPVLGRWSDRWGRKPTIMLSLLGAAVSYVILGLANSVLLLFVSRALAGICAGSISSAQAYIADITTPQTRAKGMGMIGAAFSLGFVFGPALGGVLSHFYGHAMPGFAAAALSFTASVLAVTMLPESLPPERRVVHPPERSRLHDIRVAFAHPTLGLLFALFFFVTFSLANMYGTFTLLCLDDLHLTIAQNGYLFGYMGVVGALMQGGIHTFSRRFHEVHILIVGCALMAIGLALFPLAHGIPMTMLAITFLAGGNGMNNPTILALISKNAPAGEQGATLGVNQSVGSLSRVVGPAWGDYAYQAFGHGTPFITGAVVMVGTVFASFRLRARHVNQTPDHSRATNPPNASAAD